MATTESTSTSAAPARRATSARRAGSARRPAAKRAAAARPRRTSTNTTRPATRSARAQQLAGRAVLIPVGAALEARDRVAGTVGELVSTTRSRTALERQLDRFERRGGSARTQLEREVRRTRTQLERQTRTARRGFERQRAQARRRLDRNVETLTTRVERVVKDGVDAGIKLVNGAQDRLGRIV